MGERGAVHTFRPKWTERNRATGARRLVSGDAWCWRFSYRGKRYSGGKRDGVGFKTRAAARAAGEERKRQVVAGHLDDPRKTTFETLEQAITAEYELKDQSTQRTLRFSFDRLRQFFGNQLAMDITRTLALEYVRHRRIAGARDSTIKLELAYLRRAMNIALDQGRLLAVPRFPSLKVSPRKQFFRPDEFAALCAELRPHYLHFFEAAHEMGWRCASELKSRRWNPHVDFESGWVRLEPGETKNDEPRLFPMTARLRAILEAQRAYVTELERVSGKIVSWVFPRPDGRQLGNWHAAWRSACARAGLVDKRPHDLRRTAVMRFEAEGLSRSASMALTGHKTEAIFRQYAQVDLRALLQAAEILDRGEARREKQEATVTRIKRKG